MRAAGVLFALALVACAFAAARLVGAAGPAGLELGRARTTSLEPDMARELERAGGDVLVQWFATPRAELPSEYGAVADAVEALFAALRAGAPGVRTQVLHPDDAEAERYARSLGLGPFRARRIVRDGWSESEVWSALRVVRGASGAAVVRALTPELAPDLQRLVAAHLAEVAAPRRPRVGLSAPPGHVELRRALDGYADVRELDLDLDPRVPADLDLVLWIAPARADARHVDALRGFLDRGGSALVAASRYGAQVAGALLEFTPTGAPLDALLPAFGLESFRGHVLESPPRAGAAEYPFQVLRSIGSRQDFRIFGEQPNGTLAFGTPSPLLPLAERLRETGATFRSLATSSDRCFELPSTLVSVPTAELARGDVGGALPPVPLLALVQPLDPTRGSLVVASSATPFGDASFADEAYVHRELVRVLVEGLASAERRALAAVARARPAPLPELSRAERWTARAACIALVPFLLVALGLARGAFAGLGAGRRALLLPGIAAALVLALGLAARAFGARSGLDLARDAGHRLAPELVARAQRLADPGGLVVETAFSDAAALPPELRPLAAEARDLCDALYRAVPGAARRDVDPEGFDEAERARLGLRRLAGTSQADEELVARSFYAAVALEAGGRREVLDLGDAGAYEHLPFRVAVALLTLERGRAPTLAVASEAARVTPAEALELYQRRGLFAPTAGDPFASARALLAAHGFRVVTVDAAAAAIPDCDAFVWLQPRRDASRLAAALARHLAAGGRALVAAQTHRVRPRLRDARGAEPALWPEPLFPDVDRLWLPRLGVTLSGELVFDVLHGALEVDGTAERGGRVEAARATLSNPLVVRTTPAERPADPATAGVGDLLLLSPTRIALDPAALAAHGLAARPLLTTTDRAWTRAWSGGDLPADAFEPPAGVRAPLALAVGVEGTFPGPEVEPAFDLAGESAAGARPGALVLVGASEPFTDAELRLAGYDHARCLLQACAALALPEDVARVLARGASRGGFGHVEPAARLTARALGLAVGPLGVLLVGLAWRARRARRIAREALAA